MRLAFFGSAYDPQVAHVLAVAAGRGHQVVVCGPEDWRGDGAVPHRLRIEGGVTSLDFGGGALHDVDGVWVRHLIPPFPVVDTTPGLPPFDRDELFVLSMNLRERASLLFSAIDFLVAQGRPVLNPPAPGLGIQNKPTQLMLMARAGVPVPETLVSDDPDQVRDFAKGRRVIFKPAAGGALAVELNPEHDESLGLIIKAPVIFQELVAGEDVRVTMIDDQILSAVVVETEEGQIDFRSSERYAAGLGTYREVQLPEGVVKAVRATRRALGLRFTGIDVRLDPARPEAFVVLEANPSPTYLDIERKLGHPISAGLVDALTVR
ncbi:MAG: ATP-grasp domain-containing protein [Deltaproteobacteria bacterium]|nr:ATP-grasp domain-containing protein [Deltaproteobacteria bacterium]